jgi:hypothetical protein
MALRPGDRVRICAADNEYAGCRGTVADAPAMAADGVTALGHHVAIDGENGLVRPFLIHELEQIGPVSVRRRGAHDAARSGTRG